nr:MAG TPA: hypothetical protein [Caudoviricetes sp.]
MFPYSLRLRLPAVPCPHCTALHLLLFLCTWSLSVLPSEVPSHLSFFLLCTEFQFFVYPRRLDAYKFFSVLPSHSHLLILGKKNNASELNSNALSLFLYKKINANRVIPLFAFILLLYGRKVKH